MLAIILISFIALFGSLGMAQTDDPIVSYIQNQCRNYSDQVDNSKRQVDLANKDLEEKQKMLDDCQGALDRISTINTQTPVVEALPVVNTSGVNWNDVPQ